VRRPVAGTASRRSNLATCPMRRIPTLNTIAWRSTPTRCCRGRGGSSARWNCKAFASSAQTVYFVEHVFEGMLRGDQQSRSAFYQVLLRAGALTPNEIRQRENLNPIEGGDRRDHRAGSATARRSRKRTGANARGTRAAVFETGFLTLPQHGDLVCGRSGAVRRVGTGPGNIGPRGSAPGLERRGTSVVLLTRPHSCFVTWGVSRRRANHSIGAQNI
jgi:hypothetical protein